MSPIMDNHDKANMKTMRAKLIGVAAALVAFVGPLFAEETQETNAVATLERVIVTASPIAKEERFTLDGEVYIAGENVFDRHYEYFPGYEMPGAMVYVGLRLKF